MLQRLDQVQGTGSVQSRSWLVKEQDARIPEHLNGNADSPAFSAGTPALLDSIADSGISALLEAEFKNNLFDQLLMPVRSGG